MSCLKQPSTDCMISVYWSNTHIKKEIKRGNDSDYRSSSRTILPLWFVEQGEAW